MSRFLFGALAMGAFIVLTSFALRAPVEPVATRDGPAWRVSDYRLDRAFRTTFSSAAGSMTAQIPATGGFIITQVRVQPIQGSQDQSVTITINGVSEVFRALLPNSLTSGAALQELNPPVIARPNDVVTVAPSQGAATRVK
jgi:hypothetical protein